MLIKSSSHLCAHKYFQFLRVSDSQVLTVCPIFFPTYKFWGSIFLYFSVTPGDVISQPPDDYQEGFRQLTSWKEKIGLLLGSKGQGVKVTIRDTTNSVCHMKGTHHTHLSVEIGLSGRAFCLLSCSHKIFIYCWRNTCETTARNQFPKDVRL